MFPELRSRLTYPARSLSGGEQQMVVLAQALVCEPRYIVIDELSLGLAPVVLNRLTPTISALAQSGIGILLIEQFASVALALARRAHIMESGQVQYTGTADELRQNPELLRNAYLLRDAGAEGHMRAAASPLQAPDG
jgi:branched-chain amino acid transport system ATP-binding protein